jgi:hypothetical protein
MRHADALPRSVNQVEKELVLSREIIRDEQERDGVCMKYKQNENFRTDEEGMLYYQMRKRPPRIDIPAD